jgi:DNA-directed RNA polymerase specialized sigma24 family protein
MFVSKGFSDAEDLADLVINRVIKKVPEIRDTYVGEPVRYFHGVARNIMRETLRRKEVAAEVTPVFRDDFLPPSDVYECLARCLTFLPSDKRELILDYYIYDGRDKIAHHRLMASELGISEGALRGRAHHLRSNLEKCIHECLAQTAARADGQEQKSV